MKELYTIYKGWRYARDLDAGMTVREVAEKYNVYYRTVARLAYKVGFIPPDRVQRAVEMFTAN